MALILNIETATEVCSVALSDNGNLVSYRENIDGREHAALLTVFIEELLKENALTAQQLDAIAVSMGPGSYTGLRIGVSAAKGICYATGKPLIGVPTLQSMTAGYLKRTKITGSNALFCPMIDARRLEVYTAFLNTSNQYISETKAEIIDEHSFAELLENNRIYFFGDGADKCASIITHSNATFSTGFKNSSKHMISLSHEMYAEKQFKDVAYFEPFYLKDFVATVAKNKVIN